MSFPDLAEHLPAVALTDWSNCRHEHTAGRGKTPGRGTKRVECLFCGWTSVIGETPKNRELSLRVVSEIARLERQGLGCKFIARSLNISKSAASVYLKKIRKIVAANPSRAVAA